jgi:hypothetical protein
MNRPPAQMKDQRKRLGRRMRNRANAPANSSSNTAPGMIQEYCSGPGYSNKRSMGSLIISWNPQRSSIDKRDGESGPGYPFACSLAPNGCNRPEQERTAHRQHRAVPGFQVVLPPEAQDPQEVLEREVRKITPAGRCGTGSSCLPSMPGSRGPPGGFYAACLLGPSTVRPTHFFPQRASTGRRGTPSGRPAAHAPAA